MPWAGTRQGCKGEYSLTQDPWAYFTRRCNKLREAEGVTISKDRAGSKDRAWEVAGNKKLQTGMNLSGDGKMTTALIEKPLNAVRMNT